MKLIFMLICFLFNIINLAYPSNWPNYRNDTQNTGYSSDIITIPPALKWHTPDLPVEENGLVAGNGVVYQNIEKSRLMFGCNICSGNVIENYPFFTAADTMSTVAVDGDKIYSIFPFLSSYVNAYNAESTNTLWSTNIWTLGSLDNTFNGPIFDDTYIYVHAGYYFNSTQYLNAIWALDKNSGAIKLGFPINLPYQDYYSGICVDNKRIFAYNSNTTTIYGYDINANPLPNFPISVPADPSDEYFMREPVIYDNKIFIYSPVDAGNGNTGNVSVFGYDIATGNPLPGFPAPAGIRKLMLAYYFYGGLAAANNTIYAFDGNATLYAFNMVNGTPCAGFPVSTTTTAYRVWSAPTISGNNIVFVGAGMSRNLYAISGAGNSDAGTILWQYNIPGGDGQGFDLISPIITDNYLMVSQDGGGIWTFGPDLTLCKKVDKRNTYPGDTLKYSLSINTMGAASGKTGLILVDTLPALTQYILDTGPNTPVVNGLTLIWNIGDVIANTILTYSFNVELSNAWPVGVTITNQAVLYSDATNPCYSYQVKSYVNPAPAMTATSTISITTTCTFSPTATITNSTLTPTITPTSTPEPFQLIIKGNYPNPASDQTTFTYWLSNDSDVSIKIYTLAGELYRKFDGLNGKIGENSYLWNFATLRRDKKTPSGIYIFVIRAVSKITREIEIKHSKMVVLK